MATALLNTTQHDQNLETYSLIWLDASINISQENLQAQKQLRKIINYLITFEEPQQCFKYLQTIPKDDRIILIVNGTFGQILIPKIIHLKQIISIYIYCFNPQFHQLWAKQFNKIKGIIVKLDDLIHRIQTDQHHKTDESLPLCIIHTNNSNEDKSTNDLNGDYLHSQLLITCLIHMKSNLNDKNELITLCKQQYKENSNELKIIDEFERNYSSDQILSWYTKDCFLYKILNKALRVQNIHLLFLFRFVISDLEKQLEKHKCQIPIRVYRSQMMSKDEIEILKNSLGGFISINSFISTSTDYRQARSFCSLNDNSKDIERVFFEIDADPRLENIKPFADISFYSCYPEEKEVLFMIGSIFRIININRDKDEILIIRMELYSLNDHHLNDLFQYMYEKQTNEKTNLLDFSNTLNIMGKWNDAEKYYHRYLNEFSYNHHGLAECYSGLGSLAMKKGDYDLSLKWHKKSFQIQLQYLKLHEKNIANTLNRIGNVYKEKNDYINALISYEKALEIFSRVNHEDHSCIAMCMNNIGVIYELQYKYSQALDLYEKALSIWKIYRPPEHHNLGSLYKNIGRIYRRLSNYDLALSYLNLSLIIHQKSRPSQHPSIASTLANIGLVYEDKKDFSQALSYMEKAIRIYRHSLSSTHPHVIETEKDTRRISSKLK